MWELRFVPACVVLGVLGFVVPASAQNDAEDDLGWFNSTEFSFVFTDGNSDTETLGLQNSLGKEWKYSHFELKFDAVVSNTADDRFLLVEPGIVWLPGEMPTFDETSIISPEKEPDVEKYLVAGYFDRNIRENFTWRAGVGWDRNEDAGILNRYVASLTVRNLWRDSEDRKFSTGYGLSYTDREEETPDTEKDDRFAGARLELDYTENFGKSAVFETAFIGNISLKDRADYSLDLTNALSVSFTDRLSLKVSLQGLYNAEPALEDVDVFARAILVDPDGIPGSGDEFFETVTEGGTEIELGEDQIRKEELDTVFRTSLVVDF